MLCCEEQRCKNLKLKNMKSNVLCSRELLILRLLLSLAGKMALDLMMRIEGAQFKLEPFALRHAMLTPPELQKAVRLRGRLFARFQNRYNVYEFIIRFNQGSSNPHFS